MNIIDIISIMITIVITMVVILLRIYNNKYNNNNKNKNKQALFPPQTTRRTRGQERAKRYETPFLARETRPYRSYGTGRR